MVIKVKQEVLEDPPIHLSSINTATLYWDESGSLPIALIPGVYP